MRLTLEQLRATSVQEYEQRVLALRQKAYELPTRDVMLSLTVMLSGRRISEVLQLAVRDVDFEGNRITFPCLKKKSIERITLPMPSWYMLQLQRYVVINGIGDKLFDVSRYQAYRIVRRLTGYNPHAFRHLLALYLLTKGHMTLEEVRRWLCHSKYDLVLHYAKVVGYDLAMKPHPLESM